MIPILPFPLAKRARLQHLARFSLRSDTGERIENPVTTAHRAPNVSPLLTRVDEHLTSTLPLWDEKEPSDLYEKVRRRSLEVFPEPAMRHGMGWIRRIYPCESPLLSRSGTLESGSQLICNWLDSPQYPGRRRESKAVRT